MFIWLQTIYIKRFYKINNYLIRLEFSNKNYFPGNKI